ncbi:MAG: glycosyltransferase family 39 protein [Bacteroidales bacterium]|nr:glycosyltransferase family 39 protein [Bacteroidales bacterium]
MNILKSKDRIFLLYGRHPLAVILIAGLLVRLAAVIFSKGWGMFDDHFLVIEPAQSWLDGYDSNRWFPGSGPDTQPRGHSFFYPGLHYLLFLFLESLGMYDPQSKMFAVRLLHALLSLIVVWASYRMADVMSGRKAAVLTGWLMALYWFMPFLSVRNLVEVACIPFLMWGSWMIVRDEKSRYTMASFLLAGLLHGLSCSIRYQVIFFPAGFGLVLFLKEKWRVALVYGLGWLTSFVLIQGVTDLVIWGSPFAEFREYFLHNLTHAANYLTGPWYMYILLLAGILIPPVSLFLLAGWLSVWRRQQIHFLPVLLFLVFHSVFPNKQERFILPVVPYLILLGVVGYMRWLNSVRSLRLQRLISAGWVFFWVLNLAFLPVFSLNYSKRAKVESMVYLSDYQDIRVLLLEDSNSGDTQMSPRFYLDQWAAEIYVSKSHPADSLNPVFIEDPEHRPGFLLFYGTERLEHRVAQLRLLYPEIVPETVIRPGFIDRVLYRLNPLNANQTVTIYRNKAVFPYPKEISHEPRRG